MHIQPSNFHSAPGQIAPAQDQHDDQSIASVQNQDLQNDQSAPRTCINITSRYFDGLSTFILRHESISQKNKEVISEVTDRVKLLFDNTLSSSKLDMRDLNKKIEVENKNIKKALQQTNTQAKSEYFSTGSTGVAEKLYLEALQEKIKALPQLASYFESEMAANKALGSFPSGSDLEIDNVFQDTVVSLAVPQWSGAMEPFKKWNKELFSNFSPEGHESYFLTTSLKEILRDSGFLPLVQDHLKRTEEELAAIKREASRGGSIDSISFQKGALRASAQEASKEIGKVLEEYHKLILELQRRHPTKEQEAVRNYLIEARKGLAEAQKSYNKIVAGTPPFKRKEDKALDPKNREKLRQELVSQRLPVQLNCIGRMVSAFCGTSEWDLSENTTGMLRAFGAGLRLAAKAESTETLQAFVRGTPPAETTEVTPIPSEKVISQKNQPQGDLTAERSQKNEFAAEEKLSPSSIAVRLPSEEIIKIALDDIASADRKRQEKAIDTFVELIKAKDKEGIQKAIDIAFSLARGANQAQIEKDEKLLNSLQSITAGHVALGAALGLFAMFALAPAIKAAEGVVKGATTKEQRERFADGLAEIVGKTAQNTAIGIQSRATQLGAARKLFEALIKEGGDETAAAIRTFLGITELADSFRMILYKALVEQNQQGDLSKDIISLALNEITGKVPEKTQLKSWGLNILKALIKNGHGIEESISLITEKKLDTTSFFKLSDLWEALAEQGRDAEVRAVAEELLGQWTFFQVTSEEKAAARSLIARLDKVKEMK